jgi:hypothetical protein
MQEKPCWINRILNTFLNSIEWTNVRSSLEKTFSYKCKKIDGIWEIVFSPWLQEIFGGKNDGLIKVPSYEINLLNIAEEFDTVNYIGFDTDTSETIIQGEIEQSPAIFTFRKSPPNVIKSRKKYNTYTGEITTIRRS